MLFFTGFKFFKTIYLRSDGGKGEMSLDMARLEKRAIW